MAPDGWWLTTGSQHAGCSRASAYWSWTVVGKKMGQMASPAVSVSTLYVKPCAAHVASQLAPGAPRYQQPTPSALTPVQPGDMGGRDGAGGADGGDCGHTGCSCVHVGNGPGVITVWIVQLGCPTDSYARNWMVPSSSAACDHGAPYVHTWSCTPSPSQSMSAL